MQNPENRDCRPSILRGFYGISRLSHRRGTHSLRYGQLFFVNCIVFRVVLAAAFNHFWGLTGIYLACMIAPASSVPLGYFIPGPMCGGVRWCKKRRRKRKGQWEMRSRPHGAAKPDREKGGENPPAGPSAPRPIESVKQDRFFVRRVH